MTSSATNIVRRSLAAGNIIMPPTANIISGNTSVWVNPAAVVRCSASLPGGADACAAEVPAAARPSPLGDQQRADQRQHQDGALDEQGGAVHAERALGGDVVRVVPPGQEDRPDEPAGEAEERDRHLRPVPAPPADERLDEHAHDGGAEDQQQRADLPVLDVRRGDVTPWARTPLT